MGIYNGEKKMTASNESSRQTFMDDGVEERQRKRWTDVVKYNMEDLWLTVEDTRAIMPNGVETVWLTPHQRNSQPEGERQTERERERERCLHVTTISTYHADCSAPRETRVLSNSRRVKQYALRLFESVDIQQLRAQWKGITELSDLFKHDELC